MSKQGNSIDSLSISCPFLRKKDAKDIVIIIKLIFQYFFSISALNIVLCIQCYASNQIQSWTLSSAPLDWYQASRILVGPFPYQVEHVLSEKLHRPGNIIHHALVVTRFILVQNPSTRKLVVCHAQKVSLEDHNQGCHHQIPRWGFHWHAPVILRWMGPLSIE